MAIAVRQTSPVAAYPGSGTGATATVAFSSAVLSGSTLVILSVAGGLSGSTISVSDGTNGAYTVGKQGQANPGSGTYPMASGHFFLNCAAGSYNITSTNSAGNFNSYGFAVGIEITGLAASSILDAAPAINTANSADMSTNRTGTLAQTSEIVIAVGSLINAGNKTITEPSGFTNIAVNTNHTLYGLIQGSADYQIVSATTSINADWGAQGSSSFWVGVIFSLKGVTAAPATAFPYRRTRRITYPVHFPH